LHRRTFVVSSAITLATASTVSLAAPSTFATLVAALIEGGKQANDAIDWLSWGQDASLALDQGKAPPPSPVSPGIFKTKLDEAHSKIAVLELPEYEVALPKTGSVPTGGFDVTRAAVRARVSALQECIAELAEGKTAISYFKQLDARVSAQLAGLQQLSTALWDLAAKIPEKLLLETLAFQALDVESSYIPTVERTRAMVSSKLASAEAAQRHRRAVLATAATEIKVVLQVEAIDLKNQVDRLQKLDDDVQAHQQKLVEQIKVRDAATARVTYREQLLNAAEMDVEETEARLADAKRSLASINRQIDQWTAEVGKAYVCPVSGVGLDKCNDAGHAKYRDEYAERRRQAQANLDRLVKQRTEAMDLVDSTKQDLNDCHQRVKKAQDDVRLAKQDAVNADAEVNTARQALAQKARIAQEEKWRSRADLHSSENQSDQQYIQQAIGQLGAGA
jgi:chromosome segregation ATPase